MSKPKRKGISAKTRFEVFKRDQFVCQYCGKHPPLVILHLDHIVPVAEGGQDNFDNFITSCETCNFGKGATPLSCAPATFSSKADAIAEKEAQLRGYYAVAEARRLRIEDETWRIAEPFMRYFVKDSMLRSQLTSIRLFIDKVGFHEVQEAMEIALSNGSIRSVDDRFRYFCGICWSKIRESGARA